MHEKAGYKGSQPSIYLIEVECKYTILMEQRRQSGSIYLIEVECKSCIRWSYSRTTKEYLFNRSGM